MVINQLLDIIVKIDANNRIISFMSILKAYRFVIVFTY